MPSPRSRTTARRHAVQGEPAEAMMTRKQRKEIDEVPLTHEFLSLMLGVRRADVTVALHYLEQALIRMSRGQIVIVGRTEVGRQRGLSPARNSPQARLKERWWIGSKGTPSCQTRDPPKLYGTA
jgi:hypothetical protein